MKILLLNITKCGGQILKMAVGFAISGSATQIKPGNSEAAPIVWDHVEGGGPRFWVILCIVPGTSKELYCQRKCVRYLKCIISFQRKRHTDKSKHVLFFNFLADFLPPDLHIFCKSVIGSWAWKSSAYCPDYVNPPSPGKLIFKLFNKENDQLTLPLCNIRITDIFWAGGQNIFFK